MSFEWWWIPAGLTVLGLALSARRAHGPLWPFLLLLPILLVTATFAVLRPQGNPWLGPLLSRDSVFQWLLALRFVCAVLMIILASGRRLAATALGLGALLADPQLFDYFACALGMPLCS